MKPTKLATGIDLLQAIEPLLAELTHKASNKTYAAWVLSSLRRELETSSKTVKAIIEPFYDVQEDDEMEGLF